MLIGVISDTHDRLETVAAALAFFYAQQVDVVIHCGDWKSPATTEAFLETAREYNLPVRAVLGNNDKDVSQFLDIAKEKHDDIHLYEGVYQLSIDTIPMAIYHGHHAPTLRRVRANTAYEMVFLGHTHKPLIEHDGVRIIINPGSTAFSIPRSKTWRPSVALVDTRHRSATIHYLSIV